MFEWNLCPSLCKGHLTDINAVLPYFSFLLYPADLSVQLDILFRNYTPKGWIG